MLPRLRSPAGTVGSLRRSEGSKPNPAVTSEFLAQRPARRKAPGAGIILQRQLGFWPLLCTVENKKWVGWLAAIAEEKG